MSERTEQLHVGIRAEWFSIGWMLLEAAVAVGAGVSARSVALLAFGLDSVIEVVSGVVVLGRLRAEQSLPDMFSERIERLEQRASRIVGWSLVLLAIYVIGHSAYDLLTRAAADASPLGIALAAAALVVMPVLVRVKRRIASAIDSPALRGDAAENVVCAYMAATLLAGLGVRGVFGWWWADPVAALGIVYFIAREAAEVLAGERGPE